VPKGSMFGNRFVYEAVEVPRSGVRPSLRCTSPQCRSMDGAEFLSIEAIVAMLCLGYIPIEPELMSYFRSVFLSLRLITLSHLMNT
jgi:hypothetical protein